MQTIDPAATFLFDPALSTAIAADGEHQPSVPTPKGPLTPDMLNKMHRYWRAANYFCIGQIYLFENPLLREPLKAEQSNRRCSATGEPRPGKTLSTFILIV